MREDALDLEMLQAREALEQCPHVFGKEAQPAHPRIHLDMHPRGAAQFAGGTVQSLGGLQGEYRRAEVVQDNVARLPGGAIAQDQNRGVDACLAQQQGLADAGHAQPLGAVVQSGPRDLDGAVAVSVGLEDGHDARVGSHHLAQQPHVVGDGFEVDLYPCRTAWTLQTHVAPPSILARHPFSIAVRRRQQGASDRLHASGRASLDEDQVAWLE